MRERLLGISEYGSNYKKLVKKAEEILEQFKNQSFTVGEIDWILDEARERLAAYATYHGIAERYLS